MKIDLFSLSELFDVLDAVVSFRQQGQKIFIESLGGFDIISTDCYFLPSLRNMFSLYLFVC